jgi:membrane protease YdiL (CAAX protease family)
MKPEDLPPDQLALMGLFSLVMLTFLFGMVCVHLWAIVRWNQIKFWQGWRRDVKADRVGLVDLIAFAGCVIMAQFVVVGIAGSILGPDAFRLPDETKVPANAPAELQPTGMLVVGDLNGQSVAKGQEGKQESKIAAADSNVGEGKAEKEGNAEKEDSEDSPSSWAAFAISSAFILAAMGSIFLVIHRTRSTALSLGIYSQEFFKDIWVGVLVFFWATPVVLIVSSVAGQMTQVQYEHPVIDAMQESFSAFPLLYFSAAIAAPLWEEYAFRFLLIRWLDTLRVHFGNWIAVFTGNPFGRGANEQIQANEVSLVWAQALGGASRGAGEEYQQDGAFPPFWIALVSGTLFGLAHWGYGVSWIPLLVLGTIMARVYQLRRSVVPCVVIHALFNTMSLIGLAGGLILQKLAPEAASLLFFWY